MILVIDNYDSFTYNLVQTLYELGHEVVVHRNDQISIDAIAAMQPEAIVISSGPGVPESAGISMGVVSEFGALIPILGVNLGHHVIAAVYGAELVPAPEKMHGRTTVVESSGEGLFKGLGNRPFKAMCYHSKVVDETTLPASLEVNARGEDGSVMGMAHRVHQVAGLQFHPDSIMTPVGKRVIRNFVREYGVKSDI